MFLSIIIPVHDVAKYLPSCLDSILKQDFEDYEILLVENGSSDESMSVCSGYSSSYKKIRVYQLKEAGVSNARNFGLKKALGDYVWFVDGDDFITTNALLVIYESIRKWEYPDVLIFKLLATDDIVDLESQVGESHRITKVDAVNGLYNSKKWNGYIANKVFKRDKFIVELNPDIHMAEDLVFNTLNFLNIETFIYLDYVAYYYRRRNDSISSLFDKKKISSFLAYELLYKAIPSDDEYNYARNILSIAKVDFSRQILNYYYRNDRQEYYKVKSKFSKIIIDNLGSYRSWISKVGAYLTLYAPLLVKYINNFSNSSLKIWFKTPFGRHHNTRDL